MSVFRETIATEALRQASRHVRWISILLTKHICFIADLNTRFFSCTHFFFMDQFLLFVLVGRRMYWALWNATVWSVSHKKHFWKLHFCKIGQFLSDKLYKFLISDLNFKIDVYDLACFFWHVTRLLNPTDSNQLSTYHQTARTWKMSDVLFAAADNHNCFKTTY